jgi:hypothetical protein
MKILLRILLSFLLCASFGIHCPAQSGIVTTYVEPGMPEDGAPAITQRLDGPLVASDNKGGFYVASSNRIYHVGADDRLCLFAGTGVYGYSGDGGPAISAQLANPDCMTVDAMGNVYIADIGNHRIRKVDPEGIITSVAGDGTAGYGGDGGQAVMAQLNFPEGVAVDSSGNLYIADSNNCRIRKVTKDGTITTIARCVESAYVADSSPDVFSGICPIVASVAVDKAGNLYFPDVQRIRKLTPDGVIAAVAGNGTSGFSGDEGPAVSAQLGMPMSVAVDPAGNLFIADGSRIRKVSQNGIISTVVGNGTSGYSGDGGPATSAQISGVCTVAVDPAGNLYIADYSNDCVRKVTPDGMITTVAGIGKKGSEPDGNPADIR